MNNQSFNKARKIMLESQIRPNKVIDEMVLSAFANIPREIFVHKSMQDIAYIDEDLPLSNGRYLMEPMVLARLIQSLELNESDNVMIIGIGTGYSVAIISQIVTSVIGIESRATLIQKAENNLTELDITNAVLFKERLQDGFSKEAPYDAILLLPPGNLSIIFLILNTNLSKVLKEFNSSFVFGSFNFAPRSSIIPNSYALVLLNGVTNLFKKEYVNIISDILLAIYNSQLVYYFLIQ